MNIAVCGTAVPGMYGGAEQLVENLVGALRAAGHTAEAVRLPAAWDRTRLLDAALAWRLVPLDVDLVIATNFPSYFVRHPRKVVWLLHQHRGAYELAGTELSDLDDGDDALELQRMLTLWDGRALAEAERRFSLSRVVSDRLARTCGLDAEPLYHPAPLADRLVEGPFTSEVLVATRLERNKRPGLAVEAMARVATPGARLAVAGRGSLAGELENRVAELGLGDRVELAGWVADDDLVARFARAGVVVVTPLDEDYGYVTLQAFGAGKPVVTTSDAGGVLEWVTDGETGLVVDPSPDAVAGAVDRLLGDPDLARRLGATGRERVAGLSWTRVVDRLLER